MQCCSSSLWPLEGSEHSCFWIHMSTGQTAFTVFSFSPVSTMPATIMWTQLTISTTDTLPQVNWTHLVMSCVLFKCRPIISNITGHFCVPIDRRTVVFIWWDRPRCGPLTPDIEDATDEDFGPSMFSALFTQTLMDIKHVRPDLSGFLKCIWDHLNI